MNGKKVRNLFKYSTLKYLLDWHTDCIDLNAMHYYRLLLKLNPTNKGTGGYDA